MKKRNFCPFKVVDKVYCCWNDDIHKTNMDFIQSIDPEYFYFTAESFREALKGEDKYRAALAIRNIYHHSLETFFSLVCATIQSPFCVYGWMNMATTGDIRRILKCINAHEKFYTQFKVDILSWEYFSKEIFFVESINKENIKLIEYSELFAELWESLSKDYLDDYSIKEYNSIKHGFRSKSGGYKFSLGPSGTLNDPARQKEWITISASDFGSSFIATERIKGAGAKDPNIQIKKVFS